MNPSMMKTMVASGALLTLALFARADDLSPPSWRGQPGSTFQEWTFATDANPAAPILSTNSFGTASAAINVDVNGTGYYSSMMVVYGAKQGWWDIGTGTIVLTIPGSAATLTAGAYKEFQIQVTYWKDINDAPLVSISPNAVQLGTTTSTLVLSGPVGGAWYSDLSRWRLNTSGSPDTVTFTGAPGLGSQIDQIVVDVHVVPEPSGIVLLIGGAMGLISRRRRE